MELGIVIIAGASHLNTPEQFLPGSAARSHSSDSKTDAAAFWDLLGKNILDRTVERLHNAGAQLISVVPEEPKTSSEMGEDAWERALRDHARGGVERVLLVSLGAYSEFDLEDLLRFHLGSRSLVSNISDEQGPLGISVIEAKCARDGVASLRNRLSAFSSCSATYDFTGYSNRLAGWEDYRRLVQGALGGRCEIRPAGQEIKPGIWCGDGARISSSAQILAPVYIGPRARIRAGALLAAGTSIEHHSEVDCGTVVQDSSVLPRTYLGPGLHISQSVVSGSRLVHLGRNLDVELADTGLLARRGASTPLRALRAVASLLGAFGTDPGQGVSTPSRTPASVDWVRSSGFFD